MAFYLPNGSTFQVAASYAAAVPFTAVTNADDAVVTAAGHGLADGDVVELTSGWPRLSGRVFQVSDVDTNTFTLVGARTGNVSAYPAGTGGGTFREVLTWETISQITEFAPSGGEQQYLDVDFLENEDSIQYPTSKSAMTVAVTCADDPSLPFFDIVEDADDDKATLAHRLNLKNGSRVYYNGIPSITATPSTTRDEVATRVISIAVQARPSRVASVVASGS